MLAAIGVLLVVYGLVKAMLGYKIFRFSLFCCGFSVGGVIGGLIGGYMLFSGNTGGIVVVMAGLLFGIIFGVLCLLLWRAGVFIMCFAYGFLLVMIPFVISMLMNIMTFDGLKEIGFDLLTKGSVNSRIYEGFFYALAAGIVLGIVLGILGVIFARPVIILFTGLNGGAVAGAGFCLMMNMNGMGIALLLGIIVAAAGIYVQFKTTRNSTGSVSHGNVNQQVGAGRQQMSMQQASAQQATGTDFRENIGQSAAAMQSYASQTMEGLKENGGKAAAAIRRTGKEGMETLRSRQKAAMEQALARKKDMTETDLLIQTEAAMYQSKVMAWILPFVEALTGAAAALFILLGVSRIKGVYGIFYGLEMGMPVLLVACLLSAVKRNRLMASGILGGAVLVEMVMGVWLPVSFWIRIWLIALYIGLLVWYNRSFLGRRMGTFFGASVKKMVAGKETEQQSAGSFCDKCGAELSGNVKFCAKCGNKL